MGQRRKVLVAMGQGKGYARAALLGVAKFAQRHLDWVFLAAPGTQFAPIPQAEDWNADGILCHLWEQEAADHLRQLGIPYVNTSWRLLGVTCPTVMPDYNEVGEIAADHFASRGFRHFAFTGYSGHGYSQVRCDAFIKSLGKRGHAAHRFDGPEDMALDRRHDAELEHWLRMLPKPVGLFCCSDLRAQQVVLACNRLGLRVPEDVAVLGADNDEVVCSFCTPPLSSIALGGPRLGYTATELLSRLMDGEAPPKQPILVKPEGVVARQSTDTLALEDSSVVQAVRFIWRNADKPLDVEAVLKEVGLNRRTLERRFRQSLGRSPAVEIRRSRVEWLKRTLADTDLSVKDLAASAGYQHANHLTVAFRKYTGMTPIEFRRRSRMTLGPPTPGPVK